MIRAEKEGVFKIWVLRQHPKYDNLLYELMYGQGERFVDWKYNEIPKEMMQGVYERFIKQAYSKIFPKV